MVEEKIDEGNESDTTLHASEKQDSIQLMADELLSLDLDSFRNDDMYFYAGKEEFSIILELDELEGLQFDKTGPKSLLSILRDCYKNGVGLRKYSIDAEDMNDVIEIIFKNEEDQTKALVAKTTIQGRRICVHKPLGYRAPFLYHIDIFDVPFGDQKKIEEILCDTFWKLGTVFDCRVHVTEDGSWMTGKAYVLLLAYASHDFKLESYTSHKLFNNSNNVRAKWSKKAVYYPAPNS